MLYYQRGQGQFWVVERDHKIVGTAGYYPINRGDKAVEIRKMYLLLAVIEFMLSIYTKSKNQIR